MALGSSQTSLLDEEIAQLENEIEALEQEVSDLDSGIYHMRLDNGMTLEVGVSGDELQVDEDTIRAALGVAGGQATADNDQDAPIQRYLPYILLGGGALLLLVIIGIAVRLLVPQPSASPGDGTQTPTAVATSTATQTPTITPTPLPTPTPTPPLIPNDFIARAPAEMQMVSLRFKQPVYKGEWAMNGGKVTLNDGGSQVRYYDSFVGDGNTVIGGDATTVESPLYALRSADINDIVLITDRAGRKFFFRLLPFNGSDDLVERYIGPDEVWVIQPTDRPALTLVLRVKDGQRMALRGELFKTELGDE